MLSLVRAAAAVLFACTNAMAADPIALHQLVEVDVAGDAVIRLTGYDYDGDAVSPMYHDYKSILVELNVMCFAAHIYNT